MMNQNEQMLEAQKQKDALIQTTKNINDEVQEEKKEMGGILEELHANEQIKQQNINAIREMEKMSEEEKISFTKMMAQGVDNSLQLQKDRRISGLKKSQRKEIVEGLEENEKKKVIELGKTIKEDKSDREKRISASYLEMEKNVVRARARVDATGYERRNRAASNKKVVLATKKRREKDLDNLIHNMRCDALFEKKYEPDLRFNGIRKVAVHFTGLLEERERVLNRQINFVSDKQKDPTLKWNGKDEDMPTEGRPELKAKLKMFQALYFQVKNYTQSFAPGYEIERSQLRAMKMARKQLEEDNELQPSAYTQKLIEEIDLKIANQHKVVENLYNGLRNPSDEPEIVKQVKSIEAACDKLAQKAEEIEKIKENMKDLQGKELEEKENEVKAREKEAYEIIKNFCY